MGMKKQPHVTRWDPMVEYIDDNIYAATPSMRIVKDGEYVSYEDYMKLYEDREAALRAIGNWDNKSHGCHGRH